MSHVYLKLFLYVYTLMKDNALKTGFVTQSYQVNVQSLHSWIVRELVCKCCEDCVYYNGCSDYLVLYFTG